MRRLAFAYGIPLLIGLGFYGIAQIYDAFNARILAFAIKPRDKDIQQCRLKSGREDFKTLRVLVISGGGVAGLIPLSYLRYLEAKTQQPIHELFDLFVGTSTGSIIISFLNAYDDSGKTVSAAGLYDDYLRFSRSILSASIWRKIFTLNGLIAPRFDNHRLYHDFRQNTHTKLPYYQLKNYVAMMDYSIDRLELSMLKNWDCEEPRVYAPLSQTLVGTTAAPLMFAPVTYYYPHGKKATYMDGAVLANRPSLQAIRLVKQYFPNVEKLVIVSLGTGKDGLFEYHLDKKPLQHWGLLQWLEPLTKIVYFSQYYEAQEGMQDLISFVPKDKIKYYYLSTNQSIAPFDVSNTNLARIEQEAKKSVQRNLAQLNAISELIRRKERLSSSQGT